MPGTILKYFLSFLSFITIAAASFAQHAKLPAAKPDTVTFPSGNLQLKGLLWKPAGKETFPAVLFNHGSEANFIKYLFDIAPAFLDQGYAFFVPFRRGQGLSRGQGHYINDELDSVEKVEGKEARESLLISLHETTQLQDQLAGLAFLKTQPGIDTSRIAVAGVSFGGIQCILIATKPVGIKAVLDFAGAAMTWEKVPAVPIWLTKKMARVNVPVYFIQAANDFSIKPSIQLSNEMKRLGKPYKVKIYPPNGTSPRAGHSFVDMYGVWGPDVFPTLNEWINKK